MDNKDLTMGLCGMFVVFGLPVTWIVCHYAFLCWKQWQATSLIRDMIGRGYTADEIIQMFQVLGHRAPRNFKSAADVPPAKPIRQPAYAVNQ
jgi:hypothetical protein